MTNLNWKFFPVAPLGKSTAGKYDLGITYKMPPNHLESREGRRIAALRRHHVQNVYDKLAKTRGWKIEEWDDGSIVIRGVNFINVKGSVRARSSGEARIVGYKLYFKTSSEAYELRDLVGFGKRHPSETKYSCIKMPVSIADDTEEWHEHARTRRERNSISASLPAGR